MPKRNAWDFPLPPVVENCTEEIRVVFNSIEIAKSNNAKVVLERAHPPVYYIPQKDIKMEYLTKTERRTLCEFKGYAEYFNIIIENKSELYAAWTYPNPTESYTEIKDYIAFYPSKMDECYVGAEKIKAQESDFYGGWITSDVEGPFKQ